MAAAMPDVQMDEVLGLLRHCLGCDEWWPADEEFWRPGLWSKRAVCRACNAEARAESKREASRRYRARQREGQAA